MLNIRFKSNTYHIILLKRFWKIFSRVIQSVQNNPGEQHQQLISRNQNSPGLRIQTHSNHCWRYCFQGTRWKGFHCQAGKIHLSHEWSLQCRSYLERCHNQRSAWSSQRYLLGARLWASHHLQGKRREWTPRFRFGHRDFSRQQQSLPKSQSRSWKKFPGRNCSLHWRTKVHHFAASSKVWQSPACCHQKWKFVDFHFQKDIDHSNGVFRFNKF